MYTTAEMVLIGRIADIIISDEITMLSPLLEVCQKQLFKQMHPHTDREIIIVEVHLFTGVVAHIDGILREIKISDDEKVVMYPLDRL